MPLEAFRPRWATITCPTPLLVKWAVKREAALISSLYDDVHYVSLTPGAFSYAERHSRGNRLLRRFTKPYELRKFNVAAEVTLATCVSMF